MTDLKFKRIFFCFYSVVRDSFIFRPEAFIMLSDDKFHYTRVFKNIWIKRGCKYAGFSVFSIMNQEIKTLKEQLEIANAVIHHVVYSTEDSQGLAYGYLEENSLLKQNKEINNEK